MNRSMVWRLIAKDLYLYRWLIAGSLALGIASLAVARIRFMPGDIGLILFMTSIIALGVFLAMYGIMTERKEKSLLFVLSLPVSSMQYTTAKIAASLIAFLIPWIVLTATILWLSVAFDPPPDGSIPFTFVMMVFFLANFCALIALLLISGSESWAIAGILLTNFAVVVFMNTVRDLPGIGEHIDGPIQVWSATIFRILAVETAVIVLSLALAFYVQSRKKDFV